MDTGQLFQMTTVFTLIEKLNHQPLKRCSDLVQAHNVLEQQVMSSHADKFGLQSIQLEIIIGEYLQTYKNKVS